MSRDPELPVWLVLRRVQRGGVARNVGGYEDRARRMPVYLTDALDELVRAEFVVLGERDRYGLWRASLTPAGRQRLVVLNDQRREPGPLWAVSPQDQLSHALDDGLCFARCGQYLPPAAETGPTAGEAACSLCIAIMVSDLVPPPEFGTT